MLDWQNEFSIKGTRLYLDSREPRDMCFISHAHSDHLGAHRQVICTPPTARLVQHRTTAQHFTQLNYGEPFDLDEHTELTLHPAGHILGSAILYVRRASETFIYTGDFNSRPSVTVPALSIPQADTLMMESTYGLPFFRFPPRQTVVEQFLGIIEEALANGRQPVVLGYSLGKAQEIVRILTGAGHRVTVHGAIASLNEIYESCGVPLGAYRRYRREDFHGARALDLRERGVLVAPPRVTRTSFVTSFENPCRIILTGWALLKNAKYRYGVDHALPMSDHADYDGLIETIERVRPKKIYTVHGYKEFTHDLRGRGYDATFAEKEDQLTLFDD